MGDGRLVGIVETHGHWDHVQALAEVKAATAIPAERVETPDPNAFVGDETVTAPGVDGEQVTTFKVTVVDGVETPVGADLSALREVAETTGGRAYDAGSADELREVYDDIGSALVLEPGREDVSDLFAGLGLVLLLGTAVPSLLWSSRLL